MVMCGMGRMDTAQVQVRLVTQSANVGRVAMDMKKTPGIPHETEGRSGRQWGSWGDHR